MKSTDVYDALAEALDAVGAPVTRNLTVEATVLPVAVRLPGLRDQLVAFDVTAGPAPQNVHRVHVAEMPAMLFAADRRLAGDFALATMLLFGSPLLATRYFAKVNELAEVRQSRLRRLGLESNGIPAACLLRWSDVERAMTRRDLPALRRVERRLAVERRLSWRALRTQAARGRAQHNARN